MRVTLKYVDGAIMTADTLPAQGQRLETALMYVDGRNLCIAYDLSQQSRQWRNTSIINQAQQAASDTFEWCEIKHEEEGLVALEVDGELVWAYEPPSSDDVNLTDEADGFEDFGEDDYIGF